MSHTKTSLLSPEQSVSLKRNESLGSSPTPPCILSKQISPFHTALFLNRPTHYNAINDEMPVLLRHLVLKAVRNESKVLTLEGKGSGFCAGYDLQRYAEGKRGTVPGSQRMPWDPMLDFRFMWENTRCFMSLFEETSLVTAAKVHGAAIAGGSDIALCCDFVFCTKDAKLGYPPATVWGSPTTQMWAYRLGVVRAKEMLFTGRVLDAQTAHEWGLVQRVFDTKEEMDKWVDSWAQRVSNVPHNQLQMHKMLLNQVWYQQGLQTTQMMANIFDGVARHSPEGVVFKERAEDLGFRRAVEERNRDPSLYEREATERRNREMRSARLRSSL